MEAHDPNHSSQNITSPYPPPPPWYKEFVNPEIFTNPPPIPDSTYTCFGLPCLSAEMEKRNLSRHPHLDSDTMMFNPEKPLKEEFRSLFHQFYECSLCLIQQLSKLTPSKLQELKSRTQHVIKLQKNLHHILNTLQYWEAKDNLLHHLESQVQRKRDLIHFLKISLSSNDLNDSHNHSSLGL